MSHDPNRRPISDPKPDADPDAARNGTPDDLDPELALAADSDGPLARAAAALALGLARREGLEPMPDELASRVMADADAVFAREVGETSGFGEVSGAEQSAEPATLPIDAMPTASRRWKLIAASGWLSASAAAVFAVLAWRAEPDRLVVEVPVPTPVEPPPLPAPEERMIELAALVPPAELSATDHPLAGPSSGSIVWDGEAQEGYMRIEGLPPVSPEQGAYQLWIFDRDRDDRYPVDGGLFTLAEDSAVLPIRPAVPVSEPTLFAITLEPPGGVVVSDRKRVLMTAEWER